MEVALGRAWAPPGLSGWIPFSLLEQGSFRSQVSWVSLFPTSLPSSNRHWAPTRCQVLSGALTSRSCKGRRHLGGHLVEWLS